MPIQMLPAWTRLCRCGTKFLPRVHRPAAQTRIRSLATNLLNFEMGLRTLGEASDSSSAGSDRCPGVNLTEERLLSLQLTNAGLEARLSTYAKHGKSKRRIKQAIRRPVCSCGCKLPVAVLVRLCAAFWALTKPTQDSLLWSLQCGNAKKKRWHLQGAGAAAICFFYMCAPGVRVCREAWAHMLGVGRGRLGRCKAAYQGKDGRSLTGPGGEKA